MTYPTRPGSRVISGRDMPDEAYHRLPELSSSGAKALLDSPERFDYWRRNGGRPPKDEYDVGHAVHLKVLGIGADVVEIPEDLLSSDGGIRTKAAKKWVEDQRQLGKVPMKAAALRPVNAAAESVLAHTKAAALLTQPGEPEVSVLTRDPESGIGIRARFDYLPYPRNPIAIAVDLKTTNKESGASPKAFRKQVESYSYYLQQEWYRHVYRVATGEEIDFKFVVVEMERPYMVGYYDLSAEFGVMGRRDLRRAIALYDECMKAGRWPGYSPDVITLEPSFWAAYENEENEVG